MYTYYRLQAPAAPGSNQMREFYVRHFQGPDGNVALMVWDPQAGQFVPRPVVGGKKWPPGPEEWKRFGVQAQQTDQNWQPVQAGGGQQPTQPQQPQFPGAQPGGNLGQWGGAQRYILQGPSTPGGNQMQTYYVLHQTDAQGGSHILVWDGQQWTRRPTVMGPNGVAIKWPPGPNQWDRWGFQASQPGGQQPTQPPVDPGKPPVDPPVDPGQPPVDPGPAQPEPAPPGDGDFLGPEEPQQPPGLGSRPVPTQGPPLPPWFYMERPSGRTQSWLEQQMWSNPWIANPQQGFPQQTPPWYMQGSPFFF